MHVKELENFLACLDILNREINYSMYDVVKSFETACEYASKYNKNIFLGFIKSYKNSDGETISDVWNKYIDSMPDTEVYDNDDINVFRSFGNLLGSGDTEIQNNNINKLKLAINERITSAKDKSEKVSSLSKIGIYVGLIIVVLLM